MDIQVGGGGLSVSRRIAGNKVRVRALGVLRFKTRYLTCKLVSIGGLTILFLILGGRGKLCKSNKVR